MPIKYNMKIGITVTFSVLSIAFTEEQFCSKAFGCSGDNSVGKVSRYILYDVNVGEGFNLKRDVYMRMAMFMQSLSQSLKEDWHLILPPWTKQWHWKNEKQWVSYPWGEFFDVKSMQLYAPVMELDQFLIDYGETVDEVYVLQHFPEFYNWKGGGEMDWSDRWKPAECRDHQYWKHDGTFRFFRGKKHVTAKQVKCISFQGPSKFLESVVSSTAARSILFDRAETATHIMFGNEDYWMCRRSMRFAKQLVSAANAFRASFLNSTDELDGVIRPLDWRDERPYQSNGGPYLGVHLRRQDFVNGRANEVPSLEESVKQIKSFLQKVNLKTVFVATDMDHEEYNYLKKILKKDGFSPIRFEATADDKSKFKEGGLAIIDQVIASHARYFVGTHESTFSFRIQEEREIMGFPVSTTFNRFCPTAKSKECTPPTKWLIKYPNNHSKDNRHGKSFSHIENGEL